MNFLLAFELPESLGGKMEFGLQTALIGVLIVFSILLLLMGVIYLFQLIFYTIPKRRKRVSLLPPVDSPNPTDGDDAQVIAVLSAAVAAYLSGSDGYVPASAERYRIRSFRRLK